MSELDYLTFEERDEIEAATADAVRAIITDLPARPGKIR